ncbi:MAG TPA: hypothetical protein VHL34_16890 [Rhizomicrobium sp.]|nr:hypothetical protein [Rhizomicrobium sp.]
MSKFASKLIQSAVAAGMLVGVARADTGLPTPPAAPEKPFNASASVLNAIKLVGGADKGATVVITNMTLTNFDASPQQVFIFAPIFSGTGATCTSGSVVGGTTPRMTVYVPAKATLIIPYPSGLVLTNKAPNCIAAEVTTLLNGGSVEIDISGYLQNK